MELEADREEITIRLLQNGRYVWTITTNKKTGEGQVARLKQLDGELADAFPNHVQPNAVKFSEFTE